LELRYANENKQASRKQSKVVIKQRVHTAALHVL